MRQNWIYKRKTARPQTVRQPEEAIRRSGLRDGMTLSFHHAFRGGDLTINPVMETIAKMGFKT